MFLGKLNYIFHDVDDVNPISSWHYEKSLPWNENRTKAEKLKLAINYMLKIIQNLAIVNETNGVLIQNYCLRKYFT